MTDGISSADRHSRTLTEKDFLDARSVKQVLIHEKELVLLREIAEKSSDLQKGFGWPKFRDACGGIERLKCSHAVAVNNWENWLEKR